MSKMQQAAAVAAGAVLINLALSGPATAKKPTPAPADLAVQVAASPPPWFTPSPDEFCYGLDPHPVWTRTADSLVYAGVVNEGGSAARDVRLVVDLPAGVGNVWACGDLGFERCEHLDALGQPASTFPRDTVRQVVCTATAMAPGAGGTVEIRYDAPAPGAYSTSAAASTSSPETDTTDNTGSHTWTTV